MKECPVGSTIQAKLYVYLKSAINKVIWICLFKQLPTQTPSSTSILSDSNQVQITRRNSGDGMSLEDRRNKFKYSSKYFRSFFPQF